MKRIFLLIATFVLFGFISVFSQVMQQNITDTNTPLHALQPDYPVPYKPPERGQIITVIDRIFNYLERTTPAGLIDSKSKSVITDIQGITGDTDFEPGVFRILSYEWGVLYGSMLAVAEATGDSKYSDYTIKRLNLIGNVSDFYRKKNNNEITEKSPVRSVLKPRALDDAGSMCAAMIKAYEIKNDKNLLPCIENYIDYITKSQFRLDDGTLARNRPLPDALWLDDLYMSVPALARMGKLTGKTKYFDDACRQIIQFSNRMFNKDKGLFMHGWIKGMEPHPEFYWGRCNGWAILAMTELLDVLPENHPQRSTILDQFRAHARGIATYQSGSGFWHQLIDRTDSYTETSATAIFTYCLAHGVNRGWLDARAFGPAAVLGWNAVMSRVNGDGQVEGTCVGTGMAFDPAFYYHRPVNVAAAHGYGPVILAGTEMLKLSEKYQIVINDSAIMFYNKGTDWSKNR